MRVLLLITAKGLALRRDRRQDQRIRRHKHSDRAQPADNLLPALPVRRFLSDDLRLLCQVGFCRLAHTRFSIPHFLLFLPHPSPGPPSDARNYIIIIM